MKNAQWHDKEVEVVGSNLSFISNSLDSSSTELTSALKQCEKAFQSLSEEAKLVDQDLAKKTKSQLDAIQFIKSQFDDFIG